MAGLAHACPPKPRVCRGGVGRLVGVLALLAAGVMLAAAPARAQMLSFPQKPPPQKKSQAAIERAGQKQMLVQANRIDYDYVNHRVAAVGNVQIYYGGSTLEADKVIYDQTTKRLHAEGNVRLTDADGKITYGTIMDLSDDYRDGFVDSLRLDAPNETRMAAARAERTAGNITVFHNGVYTACQPCKDNPLKPPLWQVKAVRIIHDQNEKELYFQDASLEFWGHPIAWLPYFSAPDPTVKRKSGVLIPSITSNSKYGAALEVPYYLALAPDYDATLAPMITTRQGVLMQGEFRQRLLNGAYEIRAAGIDQLDKNAFSSTNNPTVPSYPGAPVGGYPAPGYRDWRGSVETAGQFALNTKWVWGWDALLLSDKTFLQDYNPTLSRYHSIDPFENGASAGISQLYLTGKGNESYFDARSIYYYGFSVADVQNQIPIIHPVIDYQYTLDHPVLGGQLGFKMNFTSLTRQEASFNAITQTALTGGTGGESQCLTADSAVKTPANCVLSGIPGTYTRFSTEAQWKRTITDEYGEQWTPFAMLRADAGSMQIDNQPGVSNYINPGDNNLVRAMPTIGMEYRFPFISVESWGTQTVTPVVQVIARPNETQIGRWPNEDSQSLVFDASNLFSVDKFAGWDRVEGGGRANYGVVYTAQFNRGGDFNAVIGESYQLFGKNSYAVADSTNTGLDSGLDTTRSDYVAQASYQPNSLLTFTSRFRFDYDTLTPKRVELEGSAKFDRWDVSLLYGDYAAQPEIGFLTRRQGILGTTSVKLDANWVALGGLRYDLDTNSFDQYRIGLGYVDDCLILSMNYITNYNYGNGTPTLDHTIMMQLSLRTLGGTSLSQGIGSLGGL
jgi:LPS-assembly protein